MYCYIMDAVLTLILLVTVKTLLTNITVVDWAQTTLQNRRTSVEVSPRT